jgi:hypothetical protein
MKYKDTPDLFAGRFLPLSGRPGTPKQAVETFLKNHPLQGN